ncbi:MAG: TonB-dependent receptor [Chitinophagaceae bacterium]
MKQNYQQLTLLGCLLLLLSQAAFAQGKPPAVRGTIQNEKGEALPGVTVMVQGKGINSTATQSDAAGTFIIETLPAGGPYAFVFSYIGYEKKEMGGYHYKGSETIQLQVKMIPAGNALNDVVVVGYGTTKKVNLTGAVDQVSGEIFENRSVPNLTQGLQGAIPNLNLVMGDGKPIQSPAYNIRGNTSIGQGGNALVLVDGVEGDPSLVNPNDVASVTVLKDAASAAIYGARGSFGVVLITTKTPAKGKTSITYSAGYSIKKPTTVPEMVTNGYTFAKMFNEAWTAWNDYSQTPQNVNKTVKFSQAYLTEYEKRDKDPSLPKVDINSSGEYVYYGNTDWYSLLYKDHNSSMDHNISLSGSNDKSSFYLTGRFYNQGGIFRYNSDDYRMYNLRAKGSIQLLPWLRLDNNTDYSNMLYHNPLNVGEGGGIWRNIADEGHEMSPLLNPDGYLSYSAAYTVGDFWYGKNGIDMDRRIFRNTTGFTATPFGDKFRLKGDFTIQNTDNNAKQIRVPVPYTRKPGVVEYVGSSNNDIQSTYRETQYIATNIYGEYENRFGRAHYVKAMAGFNYEQSTYKALQALRNGLIFEDAQDINLALGQSITTSGGWERWNIAGGFFRVNYGFKDRYLLEVNGRYDGSSKFPSNQRYGFFPSVSAGWRISNESFWNIPQTVISDVKIRASYGSLGNGNISSYSFMEQFSISQSGRVLGGVRPQVTSAPGVIPDNLTWETATTKDLGLDFALLSNRLTFSGDIYVRNTTDMFTAGKSLPAVFGTAVPKGNYADLKTKGWEMSLSWRDDLRVAGRQFNYGARVTLADYSAEITRFNNNKDKMLSDYYVGQKVGEIWGYTTDGLFTKENLSEASKQTIIKASAGGQVSQVMVGDVKFKDVNGDGVVNSGISRVDSSGDLRVIGNSTPRYTYGITLDADWNGFFISAFFQGVGKQDWWPGAEADVFWGQYNRPYNRLPKSHLGKIWSEDNPQAYFPRYRGYVAQGSGRELNVQQTRYLQNVAYIRLKNIQIGYNLPQSLIRKAKMTNARIYISGENLWSWSKLYKVTKDLDVENIGGSDRVLTTGTSGNGNNYPMLKGITFGLSVTL